MIALDKDYNRIVKEWKKIMRFWDDVLVLSEWNIKLNFHSEPFECDTKAGWRTGALTSSSWKYADATIDVDCGYCSKLTDDELEEMVIHELLHIKTSFLGMESDSVDASLWEERLCTDMARALVSSRRAGVRLGRNER